MDFSTYISAILVISIGTISAEYVPVYMWGSVMSGEKVSGLQKIGEDSFKDILLEYTREKPYIVVFAERTLSPEDFAQHTADGEIAYSNLKRLRDEDIPVVYRPYVQSPIGALKQLEKKVTELSISSYLDNPNVPEDNILIIDLNDARDDEQRFHMLKRHDSTIKSIYDDMVDKHQNVLAIYTTHHTSWVFPKEVLQKRSRHLLADDKADELDGKVFNSSQVLLFLRNDAYIVKFAGGIEERVNFTASDMNISTSINTTTTTKILVDLKWANHIIQFVLIPDNHRGYWFVTEVKLDNEPLVNKEINYNKTNIYAPWRFSYHCTNLIFHPNRTDLNATVYLGGFQLQLFNHTANASFGDAYDCVGFTSIPIWSGLIVTFILIAIMTFGLTMIIDIKTMDRFDDAKGKTIVINAAE